MTQLAYRPATQNDIAFISETYQENIASLHGVPRDREVWMKLLSDQGSAYYIVHAQTPMAWFRIDHEPDELWLGMLHVKPAFQRRGIGRFVLSAVEQLAGKTGITKIGIHTTEDNHAARALYTAAGYAVTEIGPCTTADGIDRVGYTFEKQLNV